MPEYVAMFGNSQVEVVGDWVPIIVDELIGSPTVSKLANPQKTMICKTHKAHRLGVRMRNV